MTTINKDAIGLRIAAVMTKHGYSDAEISATAGRIDAAGIAPEFARSLPAVALGIMEPHARYDEAARRYMQHYKLENHTQMHNHLFGRG